MWLQSILLGTILGSLWGVLFNNQLKHPKAHVSFINITSITRFILLSLFLGILFIKQHINLTWWLISFMIAFWGVIIISNQSPSKESDENTNI